MNFFEKFKLQKNCESILLIKVFLGLVEKTFGLVYASFSLPDRQALKMTFFTSCFLKFYSLLALFKGGMVKPVCKKVQEVEFF